MRRCLASERGTLAQRRREVRIVQSGNTIGGGDTRNAKARARSIASRGAACVGRDPRCAPCGLDGVPRTRTRCASSSLQHIRVAGLGRRALVRARQPPAPYGRGSPDEPSEARHEASRRNAPTGAAGLQLGAKLDRVRAWRIDRLRVSLPRLRPAWSAEAGRSIPGIAPTLGGEHLRRALRLDSPQVAVKKSARNPQRPKCSGGSVLSREPRDVCAAFARRDHARVERVLRQGTPGTETTAHLQVTVSYPLQVCEPTPC
jgi:hypothetical protein